MKRFVQAMKGKAGLKLVKDFNLALQLVRDLNSYDENGDQIISAKVTKYSPNGHLLVEHQNYKGEILSSYKIIVSNE